MNIAQWITVVALAGSFVFMVLAVLNIRQTRRILARKEPDLLDRIAETINAVLP